MATAAKRQVRQSEVTVRVTVGGVTYEEVVAGPLVAMPNQKGGK